MTTGILIGARTAESTLAIASRRARTWLCALLSASLNLLVQAAVPAADAKPGPGLVVTFTALDDKTHPSDMTTAPNVWLYIQAGKPPTPFLPGGKFSVVWAGDLNAELRSEFIFQAELNGNLNLEIDGVAVLEGKSAGGTSPLSKVVSLKKGANPFKASFSSPDRGDAFVRLAWTEKGTITEPIPNSAFTHTNTPALEKGAQLRFGRELFLEHRCARCHWITPAEAGVPELRMDAPGFEGIGARRSYQWMARWILDPKALRATAHMPKLLHGSKAKEDAEAMAAFLASLKTGGEVRFPSADYATRQNIPKAGEEAAPAGDVRPLYERLHCIGCHNPPDAKEPDPKKLSHKLVAEKFPRGKLAEFLRTPEAHYAWTRMPNFHLSEKEAKELEDWLFAAAEKPKVVAAPTDAAIIAKGKQLVQTSGCLNCHGLRLENKFSAPQMAGWTATQWKRGCLAETPEPASKAPQFGFTAAEREALRAFGPAAQSSLRRHVPVEFAERQTRLLNCAACHGQLEGFPPLEILGGKLRPEWSAKFLAGEVPHKMRYDQHPRGEVWLEARMPAFKSRAQWLAEGLAAQHGFPPRTPPEPPVDMKLAKAGQKLAGKDGGFSCVSCHAVGPMLALEVFESEGINLAYSAERLLPSYYRRWLRNPLSIEPQTKMPVYFDGGKSQLTEILDGDAEKQITAIWQYMRLGDKMPPPAAEAQ